MITHIRDWLPFVLTVFGFLLLAAGAYVQIKSKVLQVQRDEWKALAELRKTEADEQKVEEAKYRREIEAKIAGLREEIAALKADAADKHAENEFLRGRNIALQSENAVLKEANDCNAKDLDRARAENATRLTELTTKTIECERQTHLANDLTRRLHAAGEETRRQS